MNTILTVLLLGVSVVMMASGLMRRGGIYQYPFLAGATFFGFVVPQLPGLVTDPYMPQTAVTMALVMTILCAVAAHIGWSCDRRSLKVLQWDVEPARLDVVAALLALSGAFFYYRLGALSEEVRMSSQYTGLPVALLFFAKLLNYGFVVAMISAVRTGRLVSWGIVAFCTLFYLQRILIHGRRGDTSEFILAILLALWFARGVVIPRTVMVAAVLGGTLLLWSTGDYRKAAMDDDGIAIAEVSSIDFTGNLQQLLRTGGEEMRNAAYLLLATEENMTFDLGAFHWNELVFNYVPAQLVGTDFKNSLLIDTEVTYGGRHVPTTGSTMTGMADAFTSFWYFGWIKFFLTGYVLKLMYQAARQGSVPAQAMFILSLTPAMNVITHHTQFLPSAWVHMAAFLLPALFLARRRTGAAAARPSVRFSGRRSAPASHRA